MVHSKRPSSITVFVKTFANPLLALAFKEGIDFVGDPDFRALTPKKEGEVWEVLVEHEVDDDDDEVVYHSNTQIPEKKQLTIDDYKARFDKMTPRDITGNDNKEIIYTPVKVEESGKSVIVFNPVVDTERCNSCLNCAHNEPCINVINAACAANTLRR